MELRTFNVQKVYYSCVKCTIGDSVGTDKNQIEIHREDIISMVSQLENNKPLNKCHIRKDGEQWTPFLQVVKMLVLLGIHIGIIKEVKELNPTTIIKINYGKE